MKESIYRRRLGLPNWIFMLFKAQLPLYWVCFVNTNSLFSESCSNGFSVLRSRGFLLEERGTIDLRGLGKMKTYFILRNVRASDNDLIGRRGSGGTRTANGVDVTFINDGLVELPPKSSSTNGSESPLLPGNKVAPSNMMEMSKCRATCIVLYQSNCSFRLGLREGEFRQAVKWLGKVGVWVWVGAGWERYSLPLPLVPFQLSPPPGYIDLLFFCNSNSWYHCFEIHIILEKIFPITFLSHQNSCCKLITMMR